jgi:hypothetical protein
MVSRVSVVALAVAASGCVSSYARPQFEAQSAYTQQLVEKYQHGLLPERAWSSKTGRNDTINELIFLCDGVFEEYEVTLYTNNARFNTITDFIVMAAGAGGAVATGGASQALAATAGAVTGMRSSVEKNYFAQQSRIALIAKMDAERAKVLVQIEESKQLGINYYPLSAAMSDVQRYYQAGTLLSALKAVTEDAGIQLQSRRRNLQAVRLKAVRRTTVDSGAGDTAWDDDGSDPGGFADSEEVEIFSPQSGTLGR